MIDAKQLGGMPAHPHTVPLALGGTKSSAGLTIRQHLASLAMQGIIAAQETTDTRHCAAYAIAYADALLAELAKESA